MRDGLHSGRLFVHRMSAKQIQFRIFDSSGGHVRCGLTSTISARGFLRALVTGPFDPAGGLASVLWAPVLYMVHSWYVLGSRLRAHRKALGHISKEFPMGPPSMGPYPPYRDLKYAPLFCRWVVLEL